ncbi:hypothetical protein Prum_061910 [Phytohabitans rumicis]|uniref:Uncharacterized protein n=1 Tax=Phytohabitans rumicis TaxID=1076125 RepID=A0A6V8LD83_9ACTN|nr:hypothetical protein Prum_061910 [Phytohabitans rumicis]
MGDRPGLREQPAVVAVRQEEQAHRRQHPTRRAPARLQDQHQQQRAHRHVERVEQPLPVEEAVVAAGQRQHRVQADGQGQAGEDPVGHRRPVAPVDPGHSRSVRQKDERQYAGEKNDQIELAALGQRAEDLPQHEQRHRERGDRDRAADPPGQLAGRPLLVVKVDGGRRRPVLGDRIRHVGLGVGRSGDADLAVRHDETIQQDSDIDRLANPIVSLS